LLVELLKLLCQEMKLYRLFSDFKLSH